MKKLLLLTILMLFSHCNTQKPAVNDPAWRFESLKMADGFCSKFRECAAGTLDHLKPELKEYAGSRMYAANCLDLHKKSNVYLLTGYSAEIIKRNTTECFNNFTSLSCAEIRNDALAKIQSCVIMRKIQRGDSI